jgi:hypothetical protein
LRNVSFAKFLFACKVGNTTGAFAGAGLQQLVQPFAACGFCRFCRWCKAFYILFNDAAAIGAAFYIIKINAFIFSYFTCNGDAFNTAVIFG